MQNKVPTATAVGVQRASSPLNLQRLASIMVADFHRYVALAAETRLIIIRKSDVYKLTRHYFKPRGSWSNSFRDEVTKFFHTSPVGKLVALADVSRPPSDMHY